MTKMLPLSILGFALVALPAATLAQDGIPDLTGSWVAKTGNIILADGTVNAYPDDYTENVIEISKQTGAVFTATQRISPKSGTTTGDHAGKAYDGKPNPMLGAIDGIGPFIVIADIGDTTQFQCNLVDEDSMRCTFAEPGDHAVAGFLLFERQK